MKPHTMDRSASKAREQERRRIARNVHDGLGQHMTALRMHIEVLKSQASNHPELAPSIERLRCLAGELDESLDAVTWELRPAAVERLGLGRALQQLVRNWSEHTGVVAVVDTPDLRLPRYIETHLYRLTQEALHNVQKHARANRVTVVLANDGSTAVLAITDNGTGLVQNRLGTATSGGLGLMNMRERAELCGGRLEIESSMDAGVSIVVRVPMRTRSRDLPVRQRAVEPALRRARRAFGDGFDEDELPLVHRQS